MINGGIIGTGGSGGVLPSDGKETLNIFLTSNQAQPDSNLIGKMIYVMVNDEIYSERVWAGQEVTIKVPGGTEYRIECEKVDGYATPTPQTFVAESEYVRTVTMPYNSSYVTINFSNNQAEEFDSEVSVTVSYEDEEKVFTYAGEPIEVRLPLGTEVTFTGSPYISTTCPAPEESGFESAFKTPVITHTFDTSVGSVDLEWFSEQVIIKGVIIPSWGNYTWKVIETNTEKILRSFVTRVDAYTDSVGWRLYLPYSIDYTVIPAKYASYYEAASRSFTSSLIERTIQFYFQFSRSSNTYHNTFTSTASSVDIDYSIYEDFVDIYDTYPFDKIKRCLYKQISKTDAAICYLSETNSNLFFDGTTPALLDGTQGDVMVHIPGMYIQTNDRNTIEFDWNRSDYDGDFQVLWNSSNPDIGESWIIPSNNTTYTLYIPNADWVTNTGTWATMSTSSITALKRNQRVTTTVTLSSGVSGEVHYLNPDTKEYITVAQSSGTSKSYVTGAHIQMGSNYYYGSGVDVGMTFSGKAKGSSLGSMKISAPANEVYKETRMFELPLSNVHMSGNNNQTLDSRIVNKFIGAYRGSLKDDHGGIQSVSGVLPCTVGEWQEHLPPKDGEDLAEYNLDEYYSPKNTRDGSWGVLGYWEYAALKHCMYIDLKTRNTSSVLGLGNAILTNPTSLITGSTNMLGNNNTSSSTATTYNSYRGIEGIFGGHGQYVSAEGVCGDCLWWAWQYGSYYTVDDPGKRVLIAKLPTTSGYIKEYWGSSATDLLTYTNSDGDTTTHLVGYDYPKSVGASSTTYFTDYFEYGSGPLTVDDQGNPTSWRCTKIIVGGFGNSTQNGAGYFNSKYYMRDDYMKNNCGIRITANPENYTVYTDIQEFINLPIYS